jgi:ABC-type dipeptide/oligopeptide/nickel transport system ATPase component
MAQKVAIAKALACEPKILLADEPTSNIDVTAEREIMDLLRKIKEERSLSIIFITHNLRLARDFCDRIIIMYKGEVVEENATEKIFAQPSHPYTKKLIQASGINY